MSDKVKQVSKTSQGETNSTSQQTQTEKTADAVTDVSESTEESPTRKTSTTVKPGGISSTVTKEDIAFQIQFTIPVRGGLGSS